MYENIEVEVDSYNLRMYLDKLVEARNQMQEDIEELKTAYNNAAWNDIVSEGVREQLNNYIDEYNSAVNKLNSAICATSKMCKELDNYENSIK